jgi:hypothetical protein
MYIKNKGMASFKDLKSKLQGNKVKDPIEVKKNESNPNLELEEARYLLTLIAKSDFNGKDIQIVYNVALKLQNQIKSYIEENVDSKG